MKYETLLGEPEKFIGHKEDAEILLWHDFLGPKALTQDEIQSMSEQGQIPYGAVIIAMRRIIKEPKRWTLEDKKAGRLPEVGAELIHKTRGVCEFVGVGLDENACWALKLQSGLIYIAEKSWCSPIETPAEKAQREEDEFVEELASGVARYDSFINGARAAYRKLKGGELWTN